MKNGDKLDEVITWLYEEHEGFGGLDREFLIDVLTRRGSHWARTCAHCGGEVRELYMVEDAVWLTAMPDRKGHLHFGCLERRIGRLLTQDDFYDAAVNSAIYFGMRLAAPLVEKERPEARKIGTVEAVTAVSSEINPASG